MVYLLLQHCAEMFAYYATNDLYATRLHAQRPYGSGRIKKFFESGIRRVFARRVTFGTGRFSRKCRRNSSIPNGCTSLSTSFLHESNPLVLLFRFPTMDPGHSTRDSEAHFRLSVYRQTRLLRSSNICSALRGVSARVVSPFAIMIYGSRLPLRVTLPWILRDLFFRESFYTRTFQQSRS